MYLCGRVFSPLSVFWKDHPFTAIMESGVTEFLEIRVQFSFLITVKNSNNFDFYFSILHKKYCLSMSPHLKLGKKKNVCFFSSRINIKNIQNANYKPAETRNNSTNSLNCTKIPRYQIIFLQKFNRR